MSKAAEILKAGAGHMEDRAQTYDNPEGERSIEKVVGMFNAGTGHSLTPEQGWLFMVLLKAVRTQQGGYRADNYEDGAAYFALMGEQAEKDRTLPPAPVAKELPPRHGMLSAPELAEKVRRVNGEEVFVSKSLAEAVEGELQKSYHHGCSCGLFFKSLMELGVCECGKPTQGKWHG